MSDNKIQQNVFEIPDIESKSCKLLSDEIARLCISKYNSLGKTGKPIENEWTHLSGILYELDGRLELVSLATGTKCIGVKSMRSDGAIVNDSHAEVLARRAFIRYLLHEIQLLRDNGQSKVLERLETEEAGVGRWCRVKAGVKWHMFTSRVPCGDASIIPMEEREVPEPKRQRLDIHRTGAKPLTGEDPLRPGLDYHSRGQLRRKPGRGDPTASLSCSDKMARWIYTGLQGALLSHFLEGSIYLSSIVIGGGGPFDEELIFTSLVCRAGEGRMRGAAGGPPLICQSSLAFQASQDRIRGYRPAPASIIWSNTSGKAVEVGVDGRRQGSAPRDPLNGMLKISKREILKLFLSLSIDEDMKRLNYREIKDLATSYQVLCKEFKKKMGGWSQKPEGLENFTL